MTAHHYELRLIGTPSERVRAELGGGLSVDGRTETVLITGRIGQGDLGELLVRISDLGLEIREFRRLPDVPSSGHGRTINDGAGAHDG